VSDTEFGDFSDEEDESLERKLARLRREVEEVRMECESRQKESAKDGDAPRDAEEPSDGIEKLSEVLDAIYAQRHGGLSSAEAQFDTTLQKFQKQSPDTQVRGPQNGNALPPPPQPATATQQQHEQALAQAAAFDTRLALLEKSLGLDGKSMPDLSAHAPKPILHTLDNLDRQISILSASSSNTLDAARTRIRDLTQEAERMDELRRSRAAQETANTLRSPTANGTSMPSPTDDAERNAKINALYGTLPTIASLAPTLPMVLERLRTLRLLHASAGSAAATLDEIEKRQGEQDAEIEAWREALEKVEGALEEGEGTLSQNVKVVAEWVKDLEGRVAKFS